MLEEILGFVCATPVDENGRFGASADNQEKPAPTLSKRGPSAAYKA